MHKHLLQYFKASSWAMIQAQACKPAHGSTHPLAMIPPKAMRILCVHVQTWKQTPQAPLLEEGNLGL